MTNAENQAAFRERLEKRGGKTISVALEPEAFKKLAAWQKKSGLSRTDVINRLLLESKVPSE